MEELSNGERQVQVARNEAPTDDPLHRRASAHRLHVRVQAEVRLGLLGLDADVIVEVVDSTEQSFVAQHRLAR